MKNMEDAPVQMILNHLSHMVKYQATSYLEQFNLKPGQAGILFVLNCEGVVSQRELAEKIGVKPPSMTVALKKMEEMGYVSRETDKEDLRIIRITLTAKGKKCVEEIKSVVEQSEERMFLGFSREERILMRRLLIQMLENLLNSKDFNDVNMCRLMKKM